MAGEGTQSGGVRAGFETYYVSGTPTATPAAATFTNQAGDSITSIPIGHASQVCVAADNNDAADDLILSLRIKVHDDDAAAIEVATNTTAQATAEIITPYKIGDKLLGGSSLEVWWSNETGTSTGAIVSVCVK